MTDEGRKQGVLTDNEKLCKFQGWQTTKDGKHLISIAKDYLNDDAAAMSLLDTLVEKGCKPELYYGSEDNVYSWYCCVNKTRYDEDHVASTRREAVVAAVLKMIEKEDV